MRNARLVDCDVRLLLALHCRHRALTVGFAHEIVLLPRRPGRALLLALHGDELFNALRAVRPLLLPRRRQHRPLGRLLLTAGALQHASGVDRQFLRAPRVLYLINLVHNIFRRAHRQLH